MKTDYAPYVKCDVCSRKVEPKDAQIDRTADMTVCNGCKGEYQADAESYGARVDFVEIPSDQIEWEEVEQDTDIRYEI